MIKIFLLIAALIAGLFVGPELSGGQGYVLLSFANQTIEMSLTTLIFFVVAAFVVILILEWIIKRIFGIGSSTKNWFSGRKTRIARKNTAIGLKRLHEGDWLQAEKLIGKAAKNSDSPLISYLSAAKAAQNSGNLEKRDQFLKLADEQNGHTELAVGITRAKLDIQAKQLESASANLKALHHDYQQNTEILTLLKTVSIELKDWETILRILPALGRRKLMSDEDLKTLEIQAICENMAAQSVAKDGPTLLAYWNKLSRRNKQNRTIIFTFVEQMIKVKADDDAYMILRDATKRHPHPDLIRLLPKLTLTDYLPLVKHLKNLVNNNPDNVEVKRAVALVLIKQANWDEAKKQLQAIVDITHDTDDYAKLATVLEQLNDTKGAENMAREALLNKNKMDNILPEKKAKKTEL